MDLETNIKFLVIGNGGTGKSSMAARYCKGVFTSSYRKTIGVDYLEKTIERDDGQTIRFLVWDTAGQEEFDSLTRAYYKGAHVCALVFSTTDRASFDAIEKWMRKVLDNCDCAVFALVQNKTDLISEATMTAAEVDALGKKLGIPVFRTCVKDNVNVDELFEYLGSTYINGGGDTSASSAMASLGEYVGASGSNADSANAGSSSSSSSGTRVESNQVEASGSAGSAAAASQPEGSVNKALQSTALTSPPGGGGVTAGRTSSALPGKEKAPSNVALPSHASVSDSKTYSAVSSSNSSTISASATTASSALSHSISTAPSSVSSSSAIAQSTALPPSVKAGGAFKLTQEDAKPAKKKRGMGWC